jgi:hypothetical protein
MIFDSKSLYSHALYILEKYPSKYGYIAGYLTELLKNNTPTWEENDDYIQRIKDIIEESAAKAAACVEPEDDKHDAENSAIADEAFERISKEIKFRHKIEEFYIPRQLVDVLMDLGEIPE